MKNILVGFLCPTLSYATSIQNDVDKLINTIAPGINIGIEVVDLTTGITLFQHNKARLFVPASNMKLFSDAAALMVLGPDYRFKNQLSLHSSQLQQNILKGSLYLHLSGDPSFSHTRLAILINALQYWHINRIQGNVFIDSSHSTITPYAPGWMVEDRVYSYGAPIAPIMIDANRTLVTVNPTGIPGQSAIIEVDDPSKSIILNNQVTTKASGKHCGISFAMDNDNRLTVRGCIGVGQRAVQQKMAIHNPLMYAAGLIRQQLNQANIIFDGNIILGKTPTGAMLIASDVSKPIAQLMADTLKPSDNLYADSLFLHTADKLNGAPVNWEAAQIIIKQFLQQQTGIELHNAVLTDGSGLSRHNLISPDQTVGLLRFLFDRFPLTYEYIAALPVSGRDGTLQRRFKKPNQQDLVRAKTGSMTGIASLSGYLYTANNHTLAFAIFINRLPGSNFSGHSCQLIEALCDYFLRQKPSNITWTKILSPHLRIKFQLNPTQAEKQRSKQATWRRLETMVKQALTGQTVTVLYRNNELVLNDSQLDSTRVMTTLQALRKHYSFSVTLASKTVPSIAFGNKLFALWIEIPIFPTPIQRVWTIREAVA